MDIQAVEADLSKLRAAMSEKGIVSPEPFFIVRPDGSSLHLGYEVEEIYPTLTRTFRLSTARECLDAAFEAIAKLPDSLEVSNLKYRKALANALDVAREESIPDEFSAPVKEAMDTFTERLLPDYSGAA